MRPWWRPQTPLDATAGACMRPYVVTPEVANDMILSIFPGPPA